MYQLTNILEEINCDIMEYAYLAEKKHHSSGSFKLWIPKVMSPLPFGQAKTWTGSLSNIYKNASDCKVTVGSKISLQNYVTVERHTDTDFEMRADSAGMLHVGQQFLLTMMNHDPRDPKILKVM